jgi:hypothetical protein
MGCDIHLYVEVKNPEGKWVSPENWTKEKGYFDVPCDEKYYTERNYRLFGVLAGVRDSWVTPIDEPRGLPSDVSKEVRFATDINSDHSHSWFLLQELWEVDWKSYEDGIYGFGIFLKMLERLKQLGDPSDVRIVFWFGS